MRGFFNAENGLWQIFGFIADIVVLSLLWTVFSIPLITAGAASCALYDTVAACFRRKEQDYLRRFFRTFRREFRNSLLPTLLWGGVILGAFLLFRAAVNSVSGGIAIFVTAAGIAGMILLLGIAGWVFPLLSRFTLDFPSLCGNAVRLALGHVLATFAIGAAAVLSIWLTLRFALLPLFVLPALQALFASVFLEPVFHSYETSSQE